MRARWAAVVCVAAVGAVAVAGLSFAGSGGALSSEAASAAAAGERVEALEGGVGVVGRTRSGGQRESGGGAVACPEVGELAPRDSDPGDVSAPPRVVGGCVFEATGGADLVVVSAVGEFVFSHCDISFTMRVDSRGGLKVDEVVMRGVPPCNDANPCFDSSGALQPWGGRLVATGSGPLVARIGMCLDTCIGRFAGAFAARLRRDRGGRWWLEAPDRPVGMSGWRFDGRWLLRSRRQIHIGGGRG